MVYEVGGRESFSRCKGLNSHNTTESSYVTVAGFAQRLAKTGARRGIDSDPIIVLKAAEPVQEVTVEVEGPVQQLPGLEGPVAPAPVRSAPRAVAPVQDVLLGLEGFPYVPNGSLSLLETV